MDFPSHLLIFNAELEHIQNSDLDIVPKTMDAVELCRKVLLEFKGEI